MSSHTRYVDCALSRLAPACLLSPHLTLVFPMCFQVLSQRFNRARTFVPFHRAPSTVLLASAVDYLPPSKDNKHLDGVNVKENKSND